ncbi:MAG: glycosyltransferase [Gemmatimonadota bacterium]
MTAVSISVIICTHNRAELLRHALESLVPGCAAVPGSEVLVVDNRSTDATPAVVESFIGRLPVRHVYEPVLGLCHARNTGWRASAGDIVAYFDDDAIAPPGWLVAIVDAFTAWPETGVVGGPVAPMWDAPRPAWLSDEAARALTVLDWGPDAHEIPDVGAEWLAGTNMALPRRVLVETGGFHPALDRVGNNLLSSGDVHLQRRVLALGLQVRYEPAMGVLHLVPASRLTKGWFRRRYYWQGISDSVMRMVEGAPSPSRRVRWALGGVKRLLREPRLLRDAVATPDDPRAFTDTCHALIAVGQVAGLLGAARR